MLKHRRRRCRVPLLADLDPQRNLFVRQRVQLAHVGQQKLAGSVRVDPMLVGRYNN